MARREIRGGRIFPRLCEERAPALSCFRPDTDECLGTPCQQRCKNSIGSYRCSCRTGFHLHGNQHSCVGKVGKTLSSSHSGCQSGGWTGEPRDRERSTVWTSWSPGTCTRWSPCSEPAFCWGWHGSPRKTLAFPGHMPLSSCYASVPTLSQIHPKDSSLVTHFLGCLAPLGK